MLSHKPTRTTLASFNILNQRRIQKGLPPIKPQRLSVKPQQRQEQIKPNTLILESRMMRTA